MTEKEQVPLKEQSSLPPAFAPPSQISHSGHFHTGQFQFQGQENPQPENSRL